MTDRPDTILLQGIRLEGRHGASDDERSLPQMLEVDLEVEADLRAAGRLGRPGRDGRLRAARRASAGRWSRPAAIRLLEAIAGDHRRAGAGRAGRAGRHGPGPQARRAHRRRPRLRAGGDPPGSLSRAAAGGPLRDAAAYSCCGAGASRGTSVSSMGVPPRSTEIDQRVLAFRPVLGEDVVERMRRVDALVVDGRDDVALLEPGRVRRAVRDDARARCRRPSPGPATPWSMGSPCSCATPALMGTNVMPIQGRVSGLPSIACCMMGLAMLMGMAKPMPWAPPATAVLMPMTSPAGVDERAAGVAGVDGRVGLDEVAQRALTARCRRRRPRRRRARAR